jgi:serine/threonine protein kinase
MHYGLSHPKIIKLIDVHIDTEREITYMILEYADGGTLFEKIKMETISKRDIKRYFRDVCEAMTYLHSQNIMHRDIKVTINRFSRRISS